MLILVVLLPVFQFDGRPRRAEYVDTLGEDVVIYETSIYREAAHQKNYVPPVEECHPNLIG